MEELLQQLIQQNAAMLDCINVVVERLDRLERIEYILQELVDNANQASLESRGSDIVDKLAEISDALEWTSDTSSIGQIVNEISWIKENSTAEQLLKAIESLENAIRQS